MKILKFFTKSSKDRKFDWELRGSPGLLQDFLHSELVSNKKPLKISSKLFVYKTQKHIIFTKDL